MSWLVCYLPFSLYSQTVPFFALGLQLLCSQQARTVGWAISRVTCLPSWVP